MKEKGNGEDKWDCRRERLEVDWKNEDWNKDIGEGNERKEKLRKERDMEDKEENKKERKNGEKDKSEKIGNVERNKNGIGNGVGMKRIEKKEEGKDEEDGKKGERKWKEEEERNIEGREEEIMEIMIEDFIKLRKRNLRIGGWKK